MVRLDYIGSPSEAEVALGFLQAHGIDATMFGRGDHARAYQLLRAGDIFVPESQAEEARELLSAVAADSQPALIAEPQPAPSRGPLFWIAACILLAAAFRVLFYEAGDLVDQVRFGLRRLLGG